MPIHDDDEPRRSHREQFIKFLSAGSRIENVSTIVAFFAGFITVTATTLSIFWDGTGHEPVESRFVQEIAEIKAALHSQSRSLQDLEARVQEFASFDDKTEVGLQIAAVRSSQGDQRKRIEALERGLMQDPESALSIPLLRVAMTNLEDRHAKDTDSTAKNIDRIYDQNKWFLGLMFTMALGIIGLAIGNFLQARGK